MKKADLIIFSGQSNMQGQTECLPISPPNDGMWEYVLSFDKLKPLQHPCGEDIGDLLLGAHQGFGSLLPSFCYIYRKATQNNIVAVHAAKGATAISEWHPSSERYKMLIRKVQKAKQKTSEEFDIKNIFFVWLQGESDAIKGTTKEEYESAITELKNALFKDIGIEKFMVIGTGNYTGTDADTEIISAQKAVCERDKDFLLLTDKAETILSNPDNVNAYAAGHYSNRGMEELAKAAAVKAIEFVKSKDRSRAYD